MNLGFLKNIISKGIDKAKGMIQKNASKTEQKALQAKEKSQATKAVESKTAKEKAYEKASKIKEEAKEKGHNWQAEDATGQGDFTHTAPKANNNNGNYTPYRAKEPGDKALEKGKDKGMEL